MGEKDDQKDRIGPIHMIGNNDAAGMLGDVLPADRLGTPDQPDQRFEQEDQQAVHALITSLGFAVS